MKRPATPTIIQFNLPLSDAPAATLPADKQRELALALVELLLNAALRRQNHPGPGGGGEPEADD
jgi:hypothetical protein